MYIALCARHPCAADLIEAGACSDDGVEAAVKMGARRELIALLRNGARTTPRGCYDMNPELKALAQSGDLVRRAPLLALL